MRSSRICGGQAAPRSKRRVRQVKGRRSLNIRSNSSPLALTPRVPNSGHWGGWAGFARAIVYRPCQLRSMPDRAFVAEEIRWESQCRIPGATTKHHLNGAHLVVVQEQELGRQRKANTESVNKRR